MELYQRCTVLFISSRSDPYEPNITCLWLLTLEGYCLCKRKGLKQQQRGNYLQAVNNWPFMFGEDMSKAKGVLLSMASKESK